MTGEEMLLKAATLRAINRRDRSTWPEPTTDQPDDETLREWFFDGDNEATDGCVVESDGMCEHGHPSWMLRLGLI